MSTSPSPTSTFQFPVSNGIFAHARHIRAALWVFLWAIDRTTKEVPTPDGLAEGLVYGGRPIRAQEISQELEMATRTVQTHLDHLVGAGYLRRIDHSRGMASGYAVRRSKKWRSKLCLTSCEEPSPTPLNSAEVRRKTVEGAPNSAETPPFSAGGAQDSAGGAPNSAALYGNNTQTLHRLKNIVEEKSFDDNLLPLSPPLEVEKTIERRVKEGFDYFLVRTRKSPKQYLFNKGRERQGLSGFKSLVAFAERCDSPDPLQAASDLFRVAVDRLANSPFHNGRNDQGRTYLDWHQLFRSKDHPSPTKLLEVWLDDERWPA
jgi:hypothetical protein